MRSLSLKEQAKVLGGYNEAGCNAAQALGQKLIENEVPLNDPLWDQFQSEFEKNC